MEPEILRGSASKEPYNYSDVLQLVFRFEDAIGQRRSISAPRLRGRIPSRLLDLGSTCQFGALYEFAARTVLRPLAAWVQHPLEAFLLWPLAASTRLADKCRLALCHFMGKPLPSIPE